MSSLLEDAKNGVYFVGIGGVSMSALAKLMYERGIRVCGCDARQSEFTKKLSQMGIDVKIGCVLQEEIAEDVVVYTEAVDRHSLLLENAYKSGKRIYSRAEFLGALAKEYAHVLSVAGCHGKTSATSMLAHIFFDAAAACTCHIGGEDLDFGNYHATGREYFITEACEFKRSFLSLSSEVSVILNTDLDHTDCYRSRTELLNAYREFAQKARLVVVNADDDEAQKISHTLSFGLYSGDVRAERIVSDCERYCFTVTEHGVAVVRICLKTVGKMQIYNALAAYCAARLCGMTPRTIARGLEGFHGVKRRFESVGTLNGVPVVSDYAHHPIEIAAAIATAEKLCRGTVRVVFQPHTYTRTRDLMKEFVGVLKGVESPIIYATYAAREPFDFQGSAVALVSRIPEAAYCQSTSDLSRRLRDLAQPDDLILVLGAGDIDEIVRSMLDYGSMPFCSQA